jgi:fused signal recognition particle receptor
MVVGVNGSGKTTLIAKLANRYKNEIGQSIILGAADTFRAAAVEQLKTWADRIGVPVVAQGQGADPAAVAFDTVQAAHSRDVDVVIIDTAGRLQAKYNLMRELEKIVNVVKKKVEWAPHEVLLVIDATTGQNGLSQAKAFMEAAEITHLALTKLDGTAKGGIAFAMVQQVQRPIHYIGTGEKVEDLAIFDPEAFVDALFEEVPA